MKQIPKKIRMEILYFLSQVGSHLFIITRYIYEIQT